ncbi:MAG: antibiotic biosynthesis monooxygenase [Anaerolineae bacterium]|nr:antibiotic biosynthesis monooxygenase [Anaerolineae bacterium]
MFVHITSIRVALGEIIKLRAIMADNILPLVYQQPGILRAYLVEQVDDAEHAQLILVWDTQAMHERFRNSRAAEQLFQMLNTRPGWHTQSQSYVARLRHEEATREVAVLGEQIVESGE